MGYSPSTITVAEEMEFDLGESWNAVMAEELQKPYIQELKGFLEGEKEAGIEVYPPEQQIFHAFHATPYEGVKVVIVGQDPYHGPGQAEGLSFSVAKGVKIPPSLRNIYKELESDLAIPPADHGSLESWAKQGVLLLNTTLTVSRGEPLSHHGRGWERFTDAVVEKLCERSEPLIFLLWGKQAQMKVLTIHERVKDGRHTFFTAPHPSPFAASNGFFGCKHFSKSNVLLRGLGLVEVDWSVS